MQAAITKIALGVVIDDGKALIIERMQKEVGRSGKPIVWAFPGGKIKAGESPKDAAAREVLEETGYVVEPLEKITERGHPEYPVYIHYIGCRLVSNSCLTLLPKEIVGVQWADVNVLGDIFSSPMNEEVRAYTLQTVLRKA